MTIGELISELEQYDRELSIHVYSITNDKDSIISHIGVGDDENGEMETFVSICTEDSLNQGCANNNAPSKCNLINIKPNTYKPVTEPNIEVVQMICEAFINGDTFRPYNSQDCRDDLRTKYVEHYTCIFDNCIKTQFSTPKRKKESAREIHDCDMEMAFECLNNAGYNLFAIRESNGFLRIVCSEKPYFERNGIYYNKIVKYVEHID